MNDQRETEQTRMSHTDMGTVIQVDYNQGEPTGDYLVSTSEVSNMGYYPGELG